MRSLSWKARLPKAVYKKRLCYSMGGNKQTGLTKKGFILGVEHCSLSPWGAVTIFPYPSLPTVEVQNYQVLLGFPLQVQNHSLSPCWLALTLYLEKSFYLFNLSFRKELKQFFKNCLARRPFYDITQYPISSCREAHHMNDQSCVRVFSPRWKEWPIDPLG